MAFINLSSILNGGGHNGDDLVAVERPTIKSALEANVPISDFFDELLRCQAQLVDNFYNRPIELFHNDLLNKKDGVAFKMAKAISDKCIGEYGNEVDKINDATTLLTLVYPYINIENCIRVKFASPSELKSYRESTITLDDHNWKPFNGLGYVFDKFIVPYISNFVNPQIQFNEIDRKLYDAEQENSGKLNQNASKFSLLSLEVNFSGIPISYNKKTGEVLTYDKPRISDNGLNVLGKDGVFVGVNASNSNDNMTLLKLYSFDWMPLSHFQHPMVRNIVDTTTIIDYKFVLGGALGNYKLDKEILSSANSKLENLGLKSKLGSLGNIELNDVFSISHGDISDGGMDGLCRLVGYPDAMISHLDVERFNKLLLGINVGGTKDLGTKYPNGFPCTIDKGAQADDANSPFVFEAYSTRELAISSVNDESSDFEVALPPISLLDEGSPSGILMSHVGGLSSYGISFDRSSFTCFIDDVYGISANSVGGFESCVGLFNTGFASVSVPTFDKTIDAPKSPSFLKSDKIYMKHSFINQM